MHDRSLRAHQEAAGHLAIRQRSRRRTYGGNPIKTLNQAIRTGGLFHAEKRPARGRTMPRTGWKWREHGPGDHARRDRSDRPCTGRRDRSGARLQGALRERAEGVAQVGEPLESEPQGARRAQGIRDQDRPDRGGAPERARERERRPQGERRPLRARRLRGQGHRARPLHRGHAQRRGRGRPHRAGQGRGGHHETGGRRPRRAASPSPASPPRRTSSESRTRRNAWRQSPPTSTSSSKGRKGPECPISRPSQPRATSTS